MLLRRIECNCSKVAYVCVRLGWYTVIITTLEAFYLITKPNEPSNAPFDHKISYLRKLASGLMRVMLGFSVNSKLLSGMGRDTLSNRTNSCSSSVAVATIPVLQMI